MKEEDSNKMIEETINIDMGAIDSLEKLKCFFKDPVWNKEILLIDGDSVIENLDIDIDMNRKNKYVEREDNLKRGKCNLKKQSYNNRLKRKQYERNNNFQCQFGTFQGSYIGIIMIFILLLCTWKKC